MTARAVMVLGCTSGAGKSWLTTALCRYYARQGLRVAPFKAQNMSNHARVVVGEGGEPGEIGSAQYFQALAAGVVPDVRMNPVLLKPEADTRSQVVLRGRVRSDLSAMGWRARSAELSRAAFDAYADLANDHDLIVVEGAGSPAETNLADVDFVNLGTARASAARCLLVSDIDRGGSFAHLYGTYALMPKDVRAQLVGYVLNRFRGDPSLLAPAPEDLERLTGVPTLAVIPYVHAHGLPEEDARPANRSGVDGPRVVVLAGPCASNLDEFEALATAGVAVDYAHDAAAVAQADWLVIPGSKQTRVDLQWLRGNGMAEAIAAYVRRGGAVLGICGGLQLLGDGVDDPTGREGGQPGSEAGLGLLNVNTVFGAHKRLVATVGTVSGAEGPWAVLNGLAVPGYEIHVGDTHGGPAARVIMVDPDGRAIGWQQGSVLGLYLHGLLESPAVVHALFTRRLPSRDAVFDRLADTIAVSFRPHALDGLAAGHRP